MTRHIRWQIILILLGVVLVGILLAYLDANYTTVSRPAYGGTYVEGVAGFPTYLNPLLVSSGNEVDRDLCSLIFSGLTRINARGEVAPDLARGWEISLDGKSYTFSLRANAYWHDGFPVTADDVVFTIALLQDPGFPTWPEMGVEVWRTVAVEKVDNRTVRFTLVEPYARFLDYTTVGILPVHTLRGIRAADLPNAAFNLRPIGSGPFQLEEVQLEDDLVTSLVLKRFPRHYGPRPYLDRVQFRFYANAQTALNAYAAGDVEGVSRILPSDLPRARAMPNLNLFSAQTAEYGIVLLNLRRPDLSFFQEAEVRQALLYALDRQRIIDAVLDGQAIIAHSPLIPGTWAYKRDVQRYEYDPQTANRLLDEAGWGRSEADGFFRRKGEQRMTFTLLTSSEPERLGVAQMLAEQWAMVGVTVTVRAASRLEVRDALERRDFDAVLIHIALPGDPDPYPFWHETQVENGQNYAGFTHRRASEAIERARLEVDVDRRRELYDEFQAIFAAEVPALLLYVPVYTYGVDARIHGVQVEAITYPSDRFNTLADWWIVSRRIFVNEAEVTRS